MSYYWFNRQEILQKANKKYSKEKAAQYYKQNKEAIKEKSRKRYKNLSQEESAIKTCHKKKKTRLKSIKEKNTKNWFNIKKMR